MSTRSAFTRALLRWSRPIWRFRRLSLWTEVLFWRRWIGGTKWLDERRALLDPNRPLRTEVLAVADRFSGKRLRILDVGAGPITTVGYRHPTRPDLEIELVATDVLAPDYERMLRRANIAPPVPTRHVDAERLRETFAADSFDIVFAANCVDHMIRPIDAIRSMVAVAKPGGHVVLVHFIDEGIDQEYSGLHGWNLNAEGDHLLLTNRDERIDVNDALASRATVCARVRDGIVSCEIEKRA